jgi:uncharacterized protein with LGFP repeats
LKNGGCYQVFQNGSIYWTAATDAWSVHGGMKAHWLSLGSEYSKAGYPTSGEYTENGTTVRQDFQNGTMFWTAARGAWFTNN